MRNTFIATRRDGTPVAVIRLESFSKIGSRVGSESVASMARLVTTDGEHVNLVAKGKYVIADTGEELTSDDPNAT